MNLPDTGLVAVVKRDCPTCELTEPVLATLARIDLTHGLLPGRSEHFPESVPHEYDKALDVSHKLRIEVVPTIIRREGGRENWRAPMAGIKTSGASSLASRHSANSCRTCRPGLRLKEHRARHHRRPPRSNTAKPDCNSRKIELGDQEDEIEAHV